MAPRPGNRAAGRPRSTRSLTTAKKRSRPRPARRPGRRPRPAPWSHVQLSIFLLAIAATLTLFVGGLLYLYLLLDVPRLQSVAAYRPPMTSRVLDRHGRVVARFFKENRLVVPISEMPPLLAKAFVAAEDSRFYQHPGVDIWSIFRAMLHNISARGSAHGGSTITQQVTRALLLSRKKLYSRKIKEAILAYRIDSQLSKDEILYIYLNQIYLGDRAYGVGAAAETYFNKKIGDLTLGEIALLAGLPQSPSRYSPRKNMTLARRRQAYVLNRMAEEGYISAEEARRAYGRPLVLAPAVSWSGNRYFVQQVRRLVEKKYGAGRLNTDGLTIVTTLDQTVQRAAEQTLAQGIAGLGIVDRNGETVQAGLVAIEVGSGKVRGVAGGTGFEQSQYNRAVQARRQPGSAMKPLVYAAALEQGFTPQSVLDDSPLHLPGAGRGKVWAPQNFDRRFHGPMTLSEALIRSNNIVTIKLLQAVGVKQVVGLARRMGISAPLPADLSLALGSAGISLLELTNAYTVFADHGRYQAPFFIEKIYDRNGRLLEENKPRPVQVLAPAVADAIARMLARVVTDGTGRAAGKGISGPVAGKTGTTDANVDAWFIGYTPRLAAGVWVGFDRPHSMGRAATGGRIAAPLWRDFIQQVRAGAVAGN
ncbi:MAG: PBP1A family penicillin-binding protein [Desulfobacterales bacterium]|nr:PBP1A family penicillin-binding protein [Desulfobacterales bacterium]